MIDIGANIGDSYLQVKENANDLFLEIEGDTEYFKLLEMNTKQDPLVTRVLEFISDESSTLNSSFEESNGTGHLIIDSESQNRVKFSTLVQVVNKNPEFLKCNLLKIDVDGYDSKIILGALEFLRNRKPVLFFEFSPRLQKEVGFKDADTFDKLYSVGYKKLIIYDNQGYYLMVVNSNDYLILNSLKFYAEQKEGYYYDICSFNESYEMEMLEFIDKEKIFYKEYLHLN